MVPRPEWRTFGLEPEAIPPGTEWWLRSSERNRKRKGWKSLRLHHTTMRCSGFGLGSVFSFCYVLTLVRASASEGPRWMCFLRSAGAQQVKPIDYFLQIKCIVIMILSACSISYWETDVNKSHCNRGFMSVSCPVSLLFYILKLYF